MKTAGTIKKGELLIFTADIVTAGADLAVGDIPSLSGLYLAVGTKGSAYRWGGIPMILITSDDMVGNTNVEIDTILTT